MRKFIILSLTATVLACLPTLGQAEERLANVVASGEIKVATSSGSGTCAVTLTGASFPDGMRLETYSATQLSGELDCARNGAAFVAPFHLKAATRDTLVIDRLEMKSPTLSCFAKDVQVPWNLETLDVTLNDVKAGNCSYSGVLKFKVTPATP